MKWATTYLLTYSKEKKKLMTKLYIPTRYNNSNSIFSDFCFTFFYFFSVRPSVLACFLLQFFWDYPAYFRTWNNIYQELKNSQASTFFHRTTDHCHPAGSLLLDSTIYPPWYVKLQVWSFLDFHILFMISSYFARICSYYFIYCTYIYT